MNSRKVLVIHPEGNTFNNPSLKCIIDLLVDNNVQVDIRYALSDAPMPAHEGVGLLPYATTVRRIKSILYNRTHWRLPRLILAWIEKQFIYPQYDLVIGIDRQGLIEAYLYHKQTQCPYVFISFEIMYSEETSDRFKQMEIEASQFIRGWLVQDTDRGEALAQENQINNDHRFLLPLASAGSAAPTTTRLRDDLGIPKDKQVAIVIGSITPWSMTSEILHSVSDWPENWVLIVHDRYGKTREILADLSANSSSSSNSRYESLIGNKIYISDAAAENVDEMSHILTGIDAGLAFYRPDYANPYTGKNLAILGMAAGKISTYLRHGIPVIMNDIGMYAQQAREHQFGAVVNSAEEIGASLDQMANDNTRQHAADYFNEHLDFGLYQESLFNEFLFPQS